MDQKYALTMDRYQVELEDFNDKAMAGGRLRLSLLSSFRCHNAVYWVEPWGQSRARCCTLLLQGKAGRHRGGTGREEDGAGRATAVFLRVVWKETVDDKK